MSDPLTEILPPASPTPQWTILVLVAALALSLLTLSQTLTTHWRAYLAAPREITAFIDAVESSILENESYDRDVVARVPRLDDKRRLVRLLSEIQKSGDDLREELSTLFVSGAEPLRSGRMRTGARVLWASKRTDLQDRLRRLDILRVRFLVVHLGVISAGMSATPTLPVDKVPDKFPEGGSVAVAARQGVARPALPKALTESIKKRNAPLRRLTTQAMGHNDSGVKGGPRKGWAGVMQELQKSPKLAERHASIELAMGRPPAF